MFFAKLLLVLLLVSFTWKTNIFFLFWSGKVELSNPKAELRILEVFYHKIYKVKHWGSSTLTLYWSLGLGDQYRFHVKTCYHWLCCSGISNACLDTFIFCFYRMIIESRILYFLVRSFHQMRKSRISMINTGPCEQKRLDTFDSFYIIVT